MRITGDVGAVGSASCKLKLLPGRKSSFELRLIVFLAIIIFLRIEKLICHADSLLPLTKEICSG